MQEVKAGAWWWQAVHPEWTEADAETEDWGPEVSSYAVDAGERLLLFDPTEIPAELEDEAEGREVVIVLTCPWHERSARSVADATQASILARQPDSEKRPALAAKRFEAGDHLEVGIEVFPGMEPFDLVLWLPIQRLLVAGDTLIDRGNGLEFPQDWAEKVDIDATVIREALQPLLGLPVELVLPTHGPPADARALRRALDED